MASRNSCTVTVPSLFLSSFAKFSSKFLCTSAFNSLAINAQTACLNLDSALNRFNESSTAASTGGASASSSLSHGWETASSAVNLWRTYQRCHADQCLRLSSSKMQTMDPLCHPVGTMACASALSCRGSYFLCFNRYTTINAHWHTCRQIKRRRKK